MKDRLALLSILLGWPLFVLLLTACPSTAPTKFYLLSGLPSSETPTKTGARPKDLVIGLGPIEIPQYLDRPQIVTRTSPNELELAEFHKWGEPIKDNISRVLVENLSALLQTDHVLTFPQRSTATIDYQIAVRLTRFDTSLRGETTLEARWQIMNDQEGKVLMMKRSHFTSQTNGSNYQAIASAMSQNLSDLSRTIATTIKSLERKSP